MYIYSVIEINSIRKKLAYRPHCSTLAGDLPVISARAVHIELEKNVLINNTMELLQNENYMM